MRLNRVAVMLNRDQIEMNSMTHLRHILFPIAGIFGHCHLGEYMALQCIQFCVLVNKLKNR